MMMPLMMPFVWGVLFGMCLVNSQETQVVCHQVHPCFEGHTVVAMVMETMAAAEDMLCARMSNDDATDDALRSGRPIRHVPAELARDSGDKEVSGRREGCVLGILACSSGDRSSS